MSRRTDCAASELRSKQYVIERCFQERVAIKCFQFFPSGETSGAPECIVCLLWPYRDPILKGSFWPRKCPSRAENSPLFSAFIHKIHQLTWSDPRDRSSLHIINESVNLLQVGHGLLQSMQSIITFSLLIHRVGQEPCGSCPTSEKSCWAVTFSPRGFPIV